MPCVEGLVIWCEQREGLHLIAEEAECLNIRQVLPEGRIHLVGVQDVSLDDGKGECKDEYEVQTTKKSQGVVSFFEDRCERNSHRLPLTGPEEPPKDVDLENRVDTEVEQ